MIHKAIVAALLAGLAAPVLAAEQLAGPAYSQATRLNTGRNADATYDDAAARAAAQPLPQTRVERTLAAGSLSANQPSAGAFTGIRTDLMSAPVPEPAPESRFFTRNDAASKAAAEKPAGRPIGSAGRPLGAAIGTFAGLSIGFLLFKFLS